MMFALTVAAAPPPLCQRQRKDAAEGQAEQAQARPVVPRMCHISPPKEGVCKS